jgi:sigma-E factor negative regulatory protein RseB
LNLLAVAFLAATTAASAGTGIVKDGRALVTEMANQTRALNYEGTFVYIRGTSAASMRLIHKAEHEQEQERLISLSGAAKEVVRSNNEVTCYFPGEPTVRMEGNGPGRVISSSFPQKIHKVSVNYQYTVLGGDRVAGRPTWVVKIAPLTNDRYSYRVWIDSSTRLMLKSEVLGLNDDVLEQVLFTNIEFPREIPDSAFKPAAVGQGHSKTESRSVSDTRAPSNAGQWTVQWLPEGFTMHDRRVHAMHSDGMPVDHMVYTDGLASISVFVEKLQNGGGVLDEVSSFGAVNTYSTVSADFQITLVGELPIATIKRIATSVVAPEAASDTKSPSH